MCHSDMHALSKRARDALGPEFRYARRDRHPDEPAPKTNMRKQWEPLHPDLVAHVVRPGADDHQRIKSRGIG